MWKFWNLPDIPCHCFFKGCETYPDVPCCCVFGVLTPPLTYPVGCATSLDISLLVYYKYWNLPDTSVVDIYFRFWNLPWLTLSSCSLCLILLLFDVSVWTCLLPMPVTSNRILTEPSTVSPSGTSISTSVSITHDPSVSATDQSRGMFNMQSKHSPKFVLLA